MDLDANMDVTVKVFNLTGQLVDVITEGQMTKVAHTLTWNAESFASGVYFIKVVVDNKPATHRKIVLLK